MRADGKTWNQIREQIGRYVASGTFQTEWAKAGHDVIANAAKIDASVLPSRDLGTEKRLATNAAKAAERTKVEADQAKAEAKSAKDAAKAEKDPAKA
jgi:hypothetical protein